MVETFLVGVVLFLYGAFVSWAEERFGKFQDLSPSAKQGVNTALTLVLPAIVQVVTPYWRPEFGAPDQVAQSLLYLIAPAFVWLSSQVAHRLDPHQDSSIRSMPDVPEVPRSEMEMSRYVHADFVPSSPYHNSDPGAVKMRAPDDDEPD